MITSGGLCPAHEKQTGLFHARREGSRDRSGSNGGFVRLAEFSFQAVQFDGMDTSEVGDLHQAFGKTLGSFSMAFA